MRGLIFILLVFLSSTVCAHEIQLSNQYIHINRFNSVGRQSNLISKATLSSQWEAGLLANYLERFGFYEKRLGAVAVYRPNDSFAIEARYLKAQEGAEILPQDQYNLSVYHSLADGYSPFVTYQNSNFSVTHVETLRFGMEIEKIKNLILIPQVLVGQAHFKNPRDLKGVNSLGLKAIYSIEQQYAFSVFAFKSIEASQAIVGASSQLIETKTAGLSASYYFWNDLKAEGIFDYTDLGKLNNQFLTSTLNLTWTFL